MGASASRDSEHLVRLATGTTHEMLDAILEEVKMLGGTVGYMSWPEPVCFYMHCDEDVALTVRRMQRVISVEDARAASYPATTSSVGYARDGDGDQTEYAVSVRPGTSRATMDEIIAEAKIGGAVVGFVSVDYPLRFQAALPREQVDTLRERTRCILKVEPIL